MMKYRLLLISILTSINVIAQTNYIGIGLNSAKEWEECPPIFADAMKHARQWVALDDNQPANITPDGWPLEDSECYFWSNADGHGVYRVSYTGSATPLAVGGTISNVVYDAANNRTTAQITSTNASDNYLRLRLTNVASGGARDIKIMRPLVPGSSQSYSESALFTDQIIAVLSRFNSVRYMDFLGTNSDKQDINTIWAGRLKPTYATQAAAWIPETNQKTNPANNQDWYSYQGKGVAWEYVILLANATNTDAWINIPHAADNDYINKLAKLIKYGSDGLNPYSSAQVNPVFPPLNPNLKLYIEYSNEIWNSGFPAFGYIDSQVALELANSPIFYDGSTNQNYRRYRWAAKRTIEISTIFRSVFGDSEMMTRIRPLLEWQKGRNDNDLGNANRSGTQSLMFIENNYPNPVNYYLYGGGGSGYYQADTPTDGATIDNLWDRGEFIPANWAIPKLEWSVYLTSAYGIKRMVYEGGPSFGDQNGAAGINSLAPQALKDPRIKNEIIEHQNEWTKYGGNLFTFFVLGADERWGFMQGGTDVNSFKMQGVDAIYNQPSQPVEIGFKVQDGNITSIIPGDQWKITNNGNGGTLFDNDTPSNGSFNVANGLWVSYPFHVTASGRYQVRVRYTTTAVGKIQTYLGSTLLGTTAISSTAGAEATSAWFPFDATTFDPYSIRTKASEGTFSSVQLEFQAIEPLVSNCSITAGADVNICLPKTSIKLANAPTGTTWIAKDGNPSNATINVSTGAVTGLSSVGSYTFVLTSTTDPLCFDEVRVNVSEGDLPLRLCNDGSISYTLSAQSGLKNIKWFTMAGQEVGTGQSLIVTTSLQGLADFTEAYYYIGADNITDCLVELCCPIKVLVQNCCLSPNCAGVTVIKN